MVLEQHELSDRLQGLCRENGIRREVLRLRERYVKIHSIISQGTHA